MCAILFFPWCEKQFTPSPPGCGAMTSIYPRAGCWLMTSGFPSPRAPARSSSRVRADDRPSSRFQKGCRRLSVTPPVGTNRKNTENEGRQRLADSWPSSKDEHGKPTWTKSHRTRHAVITSRGRERSGKRNLTRFLGFCKKHPLQAGADHKTPTPRIDWARHNSAPSVTVPTLTAALLP